jgi:hypothetical protein
VAESRGGATTDVNAVATGKSGINVDVPDNNAGGDTATMTLIINRGVVSAGGGGRVRLPLSLVGEFQVVAEEDAAHHWDPEERVCRGLFFLGGVGAVDFL